ncbi:LARGE xylosyl-and glucuronyltransferase 1 [Balamuthia mandrillaris]
MWSRFSYTFSCYGSVWRLSPRSLVLFAFVLYVFVLLFQLSSVSPTLPEKNVKTSAECTVAAALQRNGYDMLPPLPQRSFIPINDVACSRVVLPHFWVGSKADGEQRPEVSRQLQQTKEGRGEHRNQQERKGKESNVVHGGGPEREASTGAITLVTQLSFNRLPRLVTLAKAWQGPISAAVFLRATEEIQELSRWFREEPLAFQYVRLHLVLGKPNDPYPINTLRNVATKLALPPSAYANTVTHEDIMQQARSVFFASERHTHGVAHWLDNDLLANGMFFPSDVAHPNVLWDSPEWIMASDVDAVPSAPMPHFWQDLQRTTHQWNDTLRHDQETIYVVPALEMTEKFLEAVGTEGILKATFTLPTSKEEVDLLWQQGHLTAMHPEYPPAYHGPFSLHQWLQTDEPYRVTYQRCFEGYFIARLRNMIPYDERFLGRGYNKATHHFELYASGRALAVLPNSWLVDAPHIATIQDTSRPALLGREWASFLTDMQHKYHLHCRNGDIDRRHPDYAPLFPGAFSPSEEEEARRWPPLTPSSSCWWADENLDGTYWWWWRILDFFYSPQR